MANEVPMSCYGPHPYDRPATILANAIAFLQDPFTELLV